jgi:hypothetical protein
MQDSLPPLPFYHSLVIWVHLISQLVWPLTDDQLPKRGRVKEMEDQSIKEKKTPGDKIYYYHQHFTAN